MGAGLQGRTLIGLAVCIVSSAHRNDVGLAGVVVDETRDTIIIGERERRRIRKKGIRIEVDVGGKKIIPNGADLAGLPEERIKKIR